MTKIEWTHRPGTKGETWNPVTGCAKVSPGCEHCYALTMSHRLASNPKVGSKYAGTTHKTKGGKTQWTGDVSMHMNLLPRPLQWKTPRTVFVCSMSDLFHPDVLDSFIDLVFTIMAGTPQHTYLLLTKRPDRMRDYLNASRTRSGISACVAVNSMRTTGYTDPRDPADLQERLPWPLPNVWLGTSVEDQTRADERIPHLLQCPAAVRFLSCEPLLGPVNLSSFLQRPDNSSPGRGGSATSAVSGEGGWVIAGGESGSGARPMHPDWVRSLRDQCQEAGVPFFFKQWGEWRPCQVGEGGPYPTFVLRDPNDERIDSSGAYHLQHQIDACITDPKYGWRHPVIKLGKHASGNTLDGFQHLQWPQPSTFNFKPSTT